MPKKHKTKKEKKKKKEGLSYLQITIIVAFVYAFVYTILASYLTYIGVDFVLLFGFIPFDVSLFLLVIASTTIPVILTVTINKVIKKKKSKEKKTRKRTSDK